MLDVSPNIQFNLFELLEPNCFLCVKRIRPWSPSVQFLLSIPTHHEFFSHWGVTIHYFHHFNLKITQFSLLFIDGGEQSIRSMLKTWVQGEGAQQVYREQFLFEQGESQRRRNFGSTLILIWGHWNCLFLCLQATCCRWLCSWKQDWDGSLRPLIWPSSTW